MVHSSTGTSNAYFCCSRSSGCSRRRRMRSSPVPSRSCPRPGAILLGGGSMTLDAARRDYAEELRVRARLRNEALVQAFATVPREHFLGPGPWQLMLPPQEAGGGVYILTDDTAPRTSTGTSSWPSTRRDS